MTYRTPSPLEIRISRRLNAFGIWLKKRMKREFEGDVDFVIVVFPKRRPVGDADRQDMRDSPVASYWGSNTDRMTSAITLMELLAKWQLNGDLPPVHEWRDAEGRSLDEILGRGPH